MRKILGVLLLSLFAAAGVFAQQTSLSGTVTDPTGAVIPNATITIVNVETGQQREARADNQGRYTMPQLTPGTYKLTARAPGFVDVVVNKLELLVNEPATVPITFEKVGTTATTITVEASAVQVNTTDATLGNVVSSTAIQELPFFARNITNLLAAQPGVTNFGVSDDRSGAVNGGKSDQANVTLDGVDVNDQTNRSAFTSVLRVTLDSVEEFRSTTTNGNADMGRTSGAQIALVTRSGTNEFHGALYEYHRNTVTAANSFFNNAAQPYVKRPALLINVFGARLGGPIIKNRTFFFLNYEGRRDASASNVTRTVPSDQLRQGIVQYVDANGNNAQAGPDVLKNVVDPLHIGVNSAVQQLWNAAYPHGNDTSQGDGINFIGYRFTSPVKSDQNTYIAKFDHRLDSNGNHQVFVRGNLQNDSANDVQEFPGQPPLRVNLNNSKGLAAGYTALLRSNLVSTFRYGFTRQGAQQTGVQTTAITDFRGLSDPYGTSLGVTRIVPVHNITEDFAWNHGAHDVRFGGSVRLIKNGTLNYGHSFNSAVTNASWLRGTGSDITPASLNISSKSAVGFDDAAMALLGIVSQGNGRYNYLVDGTILPAGAPVARSYNNEEYEMYGQDTWKITRNLTLTVGLRYSLMPPVYEANGQQISANISLSDWLNKRGALAQQGLSQQGAGVISYVVASSPQGRDLYPFHKNAAPRISLAYSPKAESGLSKFFFGGPGKSSIRAGWGMFYDLIGQPLAVTYDNSAFGLQSTLVNPSGVLTASSAPRFTSFFSVPSQVVRAAPPGGFPVPQPNNFAITNSIDDKLKAPYTMNMNLSLGREFGKGLFIQASYVGRQSRHSLINRDLAMPTDLKDPKSGQTYFEAATQLQKLMLAGTKIADVPKIPFFENMWATAAAGGKTATQIIAQDLIENSSRGSDFTTTLTDMDIAGLCNVTGGTTFASDGSIDGIACGVQGPYMIFNPQFSSLSAWSSIGSGSYHGMQLTVRKQFGDGLTFHFNYTLSKSEDLASRAENAGSFNGFVINSWNPSQMKAVSGYDALHQVNAFMVWQLPVGRGRRFAGGSNKIVDALIGGWQITSSWTQSSGLTTGVGNGRKWPTNWNITGNATPTGLAQPPVTNDENAPAVSGKGGPNLWSDPKAALAAWGFTAPGQSGSRNTIRGAGNFNIDTGLAKRFIMPYSEHHSVQIRWETFNLTNSVRFDPNSANLSLTASSNFGKLSGTLTTPRQMQFALRYEF
jgi:hypothetical protein